MADLTPMGFSPETTEDMGDGFSIIPPGVYTVVIVNSEVQDTKAAGGKMLVLKYQVVEGAHTSQTLIDRLNIVNASEMAQKIGRSQLKNICDAIGFTGQLNNSEALHGKPFSVKVEIETFTSNNPKNPGKELQSNKITKRMKKQSPEEVVQMDQGAMEQQQQSQPKSTW